MNLPPPLAAPGAPEPEVSERVPRSRRARVIRMFGSRGVPPHGPSEERGEDGRSAPSTSSRADERLARLLEIASRLAAAVVVLGGILVLLGWKLDMRALQAVGPVDVVMNPLAALLFVLAGSVLAFDERQRALSLTRGWIAACGVALSISGALVLARSLTGWNAGVDEMLFPTQVRSVDPPDWMAANTALNFLLLGLAFLIRDVRGRGGWRPAHWLVLPAALMSLLVVIGYLYSNAGFITFQLQLPMALNTALFFLAACFAFLAAQPDEGVMTLFVTDSAGGAITRRLLPALLFVPLALGTLINLGIRAGWYGPTAALALLTLATIVLSVVLTITTAGALHRSDVALRQSEEHFRTLIENATDYIMIFDQEGAIRYVSPSVEQILGYTAEEMAGQKPDALVHSEDLSRVHQAIEEVFSHPGQVLSTDFRIRHRDGGWRIFESVTRTLLADSGEAGALATARDVTDRRRAEDEISRQKAYFEDILDSLDAGIVVFDPRGRFEYASASAMTEPHIRQWIIGKTMADYGRTKNLPAAVIEARQNNLAEAIRTRAPAEFEQEVRRPDGSVRQMLRRVVPIMNEAGELVRLVAFSVDISERKAVEVALQRAKEEAERANRAKSEFLSRMSHELRTPMNAILGFAQLLERRGLPPDEERHLAHILKGGKHLLQLINEVLDLSRIEAGRMALSIEPVGVNEAIREAIDLVRPISNESDTELVFEDSIGEELYASADRQRLSQVVINLLSNAIKYNRAGGQVRIEVGRSERGVAIRVRDHGRGIPQERLDQLFMPFARLGAEQTETEGTGLGLALSRRLAEGMGGCLELEETGAEGSTFRLELRLASDPLLAPHPLQSPGPGAGIENGASATILYIEDNLANLSLVEAVVESKPNWKTISALRGEAGIELAREKKPDLILLDLHLPDLPGNEVLARLRQDPATSDIPVIIISADATGAAQARLRAAGADDYLTKPLDLDEFLATVERFLPGGTRAVSPVTPAAGA